MTPDEYMVRYKAKLKELTDGKALAIAAQDTHVQYVERIFEDGKNTDDKKIGDYNSDSELYVNPRYTPKKFPTKGKNGDTVFKNKKKHKTGYFASYKDFRKSQGRQNSFVDLTLSGMLRSDLSKAVVRISKNEYAGTITKEINQKKAEGAEDKYGEIFGLTEKEKQNFKEVLEFETQRLFK